MTVINTNYSNLDEVWGTPFEKTKKKKTKPPTDPLCTLYGKRYSKLLKPFGSKGSTPLDDEYVHRYGLFEGDNTQTDTQYYGYEDAKRYNRNVNKQRQQNMDLQIDEESEINYKCMDLSARKQKNDKRKSQANKQKPKPKKKQVMFDISPEDDDEIYLQQAVQQETEAEQEDFEKYIQMCMKNRMMKWMI